MGVILWELGWGQLPASPALLGRIGCLLALIWWQFRVARAWFGVSVGLAEV